MIADSPWLITPWPFFQRWCVVSVSGRLWYDSCVTQIQHFIWKLRCVGSVLGIKKKNVTTVSHYFLWLWLICTEMRCLSQSSTSFNKLDSPQTPPLATVLLTSTVTAGNVPMVTVKIKHTDRAMTQIWGQNTNHHCQTSIKSLFKSVIFKFNLLRVEDGRNILTSASSYIASFSQDNTRLVVASPVWRCWTRTRWAWPRPPSDSPSAGSLTLLVMKKRQGLVIVLMVDGQHTSKNTLRV